MVPRAAAIVVWKLQSDLFNSPAEPPRCEILAYLEPRPRMQKAVNEPVVVEKAMAKVAKPPMAHLDLCARLVRVAPTAAIARSLA